LIINRPKVGDNDVRFEMKYCGICHSDVHIARNELGGCMYPVVPGHELVGTVVEVGSKVTKVKVGDNVGVGCIVDSCLDCNMCSIGDE
jgi:D-arabinose 1-dehydrogenase-like Zn-dependent alcohol dehydrogenase